MSNIDNGFAWANNRHKYRAAVRKRHQALIKEFESTMNSDEMVKVLLDSAVGLLMWETDDRYIVRRHLEQLVKRVRNHGEFIDF